jgi:hypothetical protein
MTKKMECDPKVPLFLVATAIAGVVKKRGGKLVRISVVRTAGNQYLIKYRCRAMDASHTRASASLSPSTPGHPLRDEVGDHD